MALCDDVRNFNTRRRNILYLMQRYLFDNAYYSSAEALKTEARLSDEMELCDNVDLDAIYLEYANFYNLKFGKYPKIVKKAKPIAKLEVSASSKTSAETAKRKATRTPESKECQSQGLQITVKKMDTDQLANDGHGKSDSEQNNNKIALLPEIEHGPATLSDEMLFGMQDWQTLVELVKATMLREPSQLRWSDVCGNRTAIDVVKEAVLTPLLYPQYFSSGLKPWRSVLLHGPPGSGKTMLAKTLYGEMQRHGVTFFNITASILISKWRGESEKLLRVLFHLAEKRAPSIIFLDEIEGMTSKRDRPNDHESSKRFKNELLQLLDGMEHQLNGVFILASTNLPWEIDEAFLRRFEKKLFVELPNGTERGNLITKLLEKSNIKLTQTHLEQLIQLSDKFTGDEIRLACKEIAMQAVRLATTTTTSNANRQAASSSNNNNNNRSADNEQSYAHAFRQIKPISVKLLAKHQEWQERHGN